MPGIAYYIIAAIAAGCLYVGWKVFVEDVDPRPLTWLGHGWRGKE